MSRPASSGQRKIDAAREASLTLARALAASGRRVGLVSFNSDAVVHSELTDDAGTVEAALALIEIGPGSRIDLGLDAARGVIDRGAATRPIGAGLFTLLVSDGQPIGSTPDQAVAAAMRLRAAGVRVPAVAVGADADWVLLARIAGGEPVWDAGDGDRFTTAFQSLLGRVDCR
jgi:Mg-chelatase subunit ChlD